MLAGVAGRRFAASAPACRCLAVAACRCAGRRRPRCWPAGVAPLGRPAPASSVRLGERRGGRACITNPWPTGAARGRVRDAWPPCAGAAATRHRSAPARASAGVDTALRPTRRGDRRATGSPCARSGPLGLAARQGSHVVPWRVRVLPPFPSRRHLPRELARLRELDGRTAVMCGARAREFDSLREYVAGDDVRSIDWRATARAADVMVRTWRPERDRRVCWSSTPGVRRAAGSVTRPGLDAAMDAALLLAALASRAGDRVDLLAFDRVPEPAVVGAARTSSWPGWSTPSRRVESTLIETDWSAVSRGDPPPAGRRSLVVLLTALDPAPLGRACSPSCPLADPPPSHRACLGGRPTGRGPGRGARRPARGLWRRRAERLRSARRVLRDELALGGRGRRRRAGPAAPSLADTYLALKAAGRL